MWETGDERCRVHRRLIGKGRIEALSSVIPAKVNGVAPPQKGWHWRAGPGDSAADEQSVRVTLPMRRHRQVKGERMKPDIVNRNQSHGWLY